MPTVATLSNTTDPFLDQRREQINEVKGQGMDGSVAEAPRSPGGTELPRAASYTYFPPVKEAFLDENSITGVKETISEDELADSASRNTSTESFSTCESSSDSAPSPPSEPVTENTDPPSAGNKRRRSVSRFFLSSHGQDASSKKLTKTQPDPSQVQVQRDKRPPSPNRSLSRLRPRSWKPSSHPSSPAVPSPSNTSVNREMSPRKEKASVTESHKKGSEGKAGSGDTSDNSKTPTASRRSSIISRRKNRPLSAIVRGSGGELDGVPVPKIPQSFSTDRLPSVAISPPSRQDQAPPLPAPIAAEKLRPRLELPRKKDELWGVFRTLDGDYQKFQSKPTTMKGNIVRQTLLPFLKNYASHSSIRSIRIEDLDRRTSILNKWWTALLELLHGRNNQSLSGTDRPAVLDGVVGIMERPEWRRYPSAFAPLSERHSPPPSSRSASSTSLASSSSDFLADSVHHNVRNTFVQNLTAQMVFVVEKMSLRNAPASLVTFCGKTCAYAFMFCPGMADLLVRLWKPSLDNMKRVFQENQGSKDLRPHEDAQRIVSAFPPCLHSLHFSTVVKASRELRKEAPAPLGTANVSWHGTWLKRWSGKESDLFYVFVKHFYILMADFLPAEASKTHRNFVPGLVMVQAQILENLTATMFRNTNPQTPEEPSSGASSVTFDDVLADPDANVSTLPIMPANATRMMAENRLIMLLRDFLSDRNNHYSHARHMFADAFGDTLKACARKIPIYDHNACFTLCDFLEEAIIILVRYESVTTSSESILDWPFWLSVFRGMTNSHNTTTEIRLYAFLYSIWVHIGGNKQRKSELCHIFLLEPEFFFTRFNHWCPMVRAYYMRLLVWRVGRYDEGMTTEDVEILNTLFSRLKTSWAHHQYLKNQAETNQSSLPSTSPCSPAPGRRILIIRTDDAPLSPTSNSFMSFDGIVPQSQSSDTEPKKPTASDRMSENNLQPLFGRMNSTESLDSTLDESPAKKKWGFLRNLMPGSNKAARGTSPDSRERSQSNASSSTASPPSSGPTTPQNGLQQVTIPTHRAFSFKFSLEWSDRRIPLPTPSRLPPPRLPSPGQNAVILFLQNQNERQELVPPQPSKPEGVAAASSRYSGRALAEWMLIVNECQVFFDRRLKEGVPSNRLVETPTLSFETFKAPR